MTTKCRRKPAAQRNVAVAPLHALSHASGPSSNTGLASDSQVASSYGLCVDYCSLVFPEAFAEKFQLCPAAAVEWLFPHCGIAVSEHKLHRWNFYPMHSFLHGPDGSLVGHVGSGGNANTICVTLSGQGCALVKDWFCTVVQARQLHAHISRVDVAFDDFESKFLENIRTVNTWAKDGEFNASGVSRPCATRFMDDHDKGAGSTVYVGSRGRKQLCVYEKGKQLGDAQSPWIRCELRLWAADAIIPLDILLKPGEYLRGAYALLAVKLPELGEELAKPERLHRAVKATGDAAVRFLRQQCGPTLDLLVRSLGPDVWTLLESRVFRSTVPRRFRGMARSLPDLRAIVRAQLAPHLPPLSAGASA